jgi:hypothetical protein
MSDSTLLVILIVLAVLAFVLGIWIGLGYPGLYRKYDHTGAHAPRVSPIRMLLNVLGRPGRGGRRTSRRGRRTSGGGSSGPRARGPGTGRWSRR